ncbi:MAG: hypothetical protein ABIT05_12035 [Chitinophagaceae bacterium]
MLPNDTRRKIENITKGIVIEGVFDNCTAIRNLLVRSFPTSTTVKENFEGQSIVKKEQASIIENYCNQHNLWVTNLPGDVRYLARGGEATVYLDDDGFNVIKLNDAVYYATWLEFLNSILLHNIIFDTTAYLLMGFAKKDDQLVAVLRQPFVQCDDQADLNDVKQFLEFNGFVNSKRQDYVHKELGLILEDMHDENVLVWQQNLFFIDTVFYTITPINE